jgi:hypothetical protein
MRTPRVGDLVLYTATEADATAVNGGGRPETDRTRGLTVGNTVRAGQEYPMVIVAVWGDSPASAVNGQVILDGDDHLWVTSVTQAGADPALTGGPQRTFRYQEEASRGARS